LAANFNSTPTWAARHIDIRKGMKFSLSGTLSSIAKGLPYTIAAQIDFPERQSIAFVGTGALNNLGPSRGGLLDHIGSKFAVWLLEKTTKKPYEPLPL
jgi:Thiamine pyrophosphate enzyme, C-terminal TPP binding domain